MLSIILQLLPVASCGYPSVHCHTIPMFFPSTPANFRDIIGPRPLGVNTEIYKISLGGNTIISNIAIRFFYSITLSRTFSSYRDIGKSCLKIYRDKKISPL